jgi:hypothetical protein
MNRCKKDTYMGDNKIHAFIQRLWFNQPANLVFLIGFETAYRLCRVVTVYPCFCFLGKLFILVCSSFESQLICDV